MDWIRRLLDRGERGVAPPVEPTWLDLPASRSPATSSSQPDGPDAERSSPTDGRSAIGFATAASADTPAGQARARLSSAFHPSTPTRDRALFAGREDTLTTLIEALEVQKLHVVVYGDRGLGKTSLLHIVSQLAGEGGYLVSYASCGSDSSFDTVFRQVAAAVPLRHHARADPALTGSDESFAGLLTDAPLDVPRVADLLGRIQGARLLILLDEFDRAQSDRFRLQVAELVKALSDSAAGVQLVIAGVASNLNELIRHIPSIRRNVIGLPLEPMLDEEVRAVVARGAERSGLSFAPDAADRLVASSNGSPYLANLLGQHSGLSATAAGRTTVSDADAKAAVRRGADELRLRLTATTLSRIGRLSTAELLDLAAAASTAMRDVGRVDVARLPQPERFGGLLESEDGGEDGSLRFAEESAVPFLWLLGLTNQGDGAERQPIARA